MLNTPEYVGTNSGAFYLEKARLADALVALINLVRSLGIQWHLVIATFTY